MFRPVLILLASFGLSSVSAIPHHNQVLHHRSPVVSVDITRADFKAATYGETWFKYKMRYRSLECADEKGTEFYTKCCLPLAVDESLESRDPECTPDVCLAPDATKETTTPEPEETEDENEDEYEYVCEDEEHVAEENLPYCDEVELEDGEEYEVVNSPAVTNPTPESTTQTPPSSTSNEPVVPPSEPAPSSEPAPAPAPSPEPAPTPEAAPVTSDRVVGGFATWFEQHGNAGACGDRNPDSALIGAIDHERWGPDFGVRSELCGRRVRVFNPNNGRSVDITIADVCPTCENGNSIDLSRAAFEALDNLSAGFIPIEWVFI